jgi:lipid II:glycine glycyltransferase (peptidoglycan interpeptide bridge formation enzyme)
MKRAMVRVLRIYDRETWNALALRFSNAHLRQSYEWGEIRRRQGWEPVRLAAFAGPECRVAMTVLTHRLPALGTLAYAPRGPLLEPGEDAAWAALPELVGALRRQTGATFLRVSPGLADRPDVRDRLSAAGFVGLPDFWSLWNAPRNIMRLDLRGSERELLGRMTPKRRQHISTGAKRDITTAFGTRLEDLRTFHRMLIEHGARQGYPVRDWDYFAALHDVFTLGEALGLAFGYVGGEPASALLGVRFGRVAYPLYAPNTPAARAGPVGDLVHWAWLRWAREAGCQEVDFGSSGTHVPPRDTDVTRGIYRFKVELGCRLELCLPYYDFVLEPLRYRLARALERSPLSRARFWWARLPAGVRAAVARRAA